MTIKVDHRHLYLQVIDRIKEDIEKGIFKEKEKLPSEFELAKSLGVSRATLREALRLLEEENVIDNAYRLEVSSPGIDANFVNIRQYQKNIGRTIQVKLIDNTKIEGTLVALDDTNINVLQKVKGKGKKAQEVGKELPFDQIKATKVVISF